MTQPRSSTLPTDSGVAGEPDVALELEPDFEIGNEIARDRLPEPCKEPIYTNNVRTVYC
jgi:hypothetical protein